LALKIIENKFGGFNLITYLCLMENKEQLRNVLVDCRKKLDKQFERQRKACLQAIVLLDAETDKDKRKELIDYLFADKVEEVFEYHFRKEYLK
jgi:hypothetical protein